MDLEAARKSLSKRSAFSTKKIAFVVAAALVLVGGVALRAGHYFGEAPTGGEPAAVEAPAPAASPTPAAAPAPSPTPAAAPSAAPEAAAPPTEAAESVAKTPAATQQAAPAPNAPAEPAGDAVEQTAPEADAVDQADQADLPGAGMILVARKPVQVLASPSASAPAMYGFPAGRPFRVIGRQGGFVQIKDLRSSASGWIDEAALARPPASAPSVAAPSQPKPKVVNQNPSAAATDPKPKAVNQKPAAAAAKKGAPVTADSEPAAEPDPGQARRPPVLFGRGGFFGGIFGNGNAN
jgi:hypothetical protein